MHAYSSPDRLLRAAAPLRDPSSINWFPRTRRSVPAHVEIGRRGRGDRHGQGGRRHRSGDPRAQAAGEMSPGTAAPPSARDSRRLRRLSRWRLTWTDSSSLTMLIEWTCPERRRGPAASLPSGAGSPRRPGSPQSPDCAPRKPRPRARPARTPAGRPCESACHVLAQLLGDWQVPALDLDTHRPTSCGRMDVRARSRAYCRARSLSIGQCPVMAPQIAWSFRARRADRGGWRLACCTCRAWRRARKPGEPHPPGYGRLTLFAAGLAVDSDRAGLPCRPARRAAVAHATWSSTCCCSTSPRSC